MARGEKYFERRVQDGMLFNTWQASLTEKQRVACELVFDQDMSLAEAAGELGVSRQAVHDLTKAARKKMERFNQYVEHVSLEKRLEHMKKLLDKYKFSLPPDFYTQMSELLKEEK